jgi:hypothetical protein
MAGKIFVNYRRDDVPGDARGVCQSLATEFGKSNVFMDVDNLLAGQRFDKELAKALNVCDVLIAVMGPHWMELFKAKAASGERDYVREEIAEALKRQVIVIPVRAGREGSMPVLPRPQELPEDIRELVLYQKHDVAHERFGRDMTALIAAIVALRKSVAADSRNPKRVPPWVWVGAAAVLAAAFLAAYFAAMPSHLSTAAPEASVHPVPAKAYAPTVPEASTSPTPDDAYARAKDGPRGMVSPAATAPEARIPPATKSEAVVPIAPEPEANSPVGMVDPRAVDPPATAPEAAVPVAPAPENFPAGMVDPPPAVQN